MATSKNDHVGQILAAVNKGFKGAATRLATGSRGDVKEAIPTGIEALDKYVLGVGGLAVGRITELYAEQGSGKTSLVLSCLAQVQKMGGVAVLVETETALNSERAKVFGVDLDQVVLLQPGHLGEAGQQIQATLAAIPAGVGPVLIAWDSVAATMSEEEAREGLTDKQGFDKRAKALSQMMRVLAPKVAEQRAHLLLVNQVRANIGVMFGDKFTTPGGNAIKFASSFRIQIMGGKAIKAPDGQHLGKDVVILATKNKLSRPYRKTRARLSFDDGWDSDWTTLNHAKEMKLIEPRSRDVTAARAALDAVAWSGAGAPLGSADEDLDPEGL